MFFLSKMYVICCFEVVVFDMECMGIVDVVVVFFINVIDFL